jgi:hypothetical protein
MKTKLEVLQKEVEMLKEQIENRPKKEANKYMVEFKSTVSRLALNTIQDLPSTLTGLVTGGSILIAHYPNFEPSVLAEAFGFGSLGAITNSHTKTPIKQPKSNYENLNENIELG